MRKVVFSLVLVLFGVAMAWPVPANNQYVEKLMADGSIVRVRLAGDEFFSYMMTEDGRIVKEEMGVMVETGMRAEDMSSRYITARRKMSRLMQEGKQRRVPAKTNSGAYSRCLVILVNFRDQSFTYSRTEFDNMLNQNGYSNYGATGSVKQYFTDNSGGVYSPDFDVFGPYTLDHNTAYYGAHSGYDNDSRPAQMALDAVRKLAADNSATVNFADYDGDNDGYIDNVFIYFAGCGENYSGNSSDYIWPHRWVISTATTDANSQSDLTFGGKKLYDYGCTSELAGQEGYASLCGIGTFCHEFSHILGLVDLYVTDYSSDHKTVGNWDLMCSGNYLNGEHTPSGYSTFERFALGWFNPPVISTSESYFVDYTLSSYEGYIITSTGEFNYDFNNPVPSEYYVLENRQNESWDTYVPGHGLLVEKIRWDAYKWYGNEANNDPYDMVVDIIEAGNSSNTEGSASDPFPGTHHVSTFTPYPEYPLTSITEVGNIVSFDAKGGAPKGPFVVTFDDRGFGIADTTSLTEDTIYSGVVLPAVTANDGYEFVGWCESMTGNSSDIDYAGTTYHPVRNTILFAVYRKDGSIVEDYYGDCITERFKNIGNSIGINISQNIDVYTENKGWTGNILETNSGLIKVGNDSEKGYIVTPELGLQGDIEIVFMLSQESRSYFSVMSEDGHSSEYPLATKGTNVVRVTLYDVKPYAKIKFSSDIYSFSIGDIHICGEKAPVSVTEIEDDQEEPVIFREKVMGGKVRIEGLKEGMRVMVIDGMGRILMTRDAESDIMEFDAPESIYFIKIL